MTYLNLKKEMLAKDVTIRAIAKILKKSTSKVSKNINGAGDFKVEEAFFIRDTFFPDCKIEDLFRREE